MNLANNPWNVKSPPKGQWLGAIGVNESGTVEFFSPVKGTRACARNLESAYEKGLRTIEALVRVMTPANDTEGSLPGRPRNNTEGYINRLAELLDVERDRVLPVPRSRPDFVVRFLRQVSDIEDKDPFPWDVLLEGVAEWYRDFDPDRETRQG
jgi:hypothetical protein